MRAFYMAIIVGLVVLLTTSSLSAQVTSADVLFGRGIHQYFSGLSLSRDTQELIGFWGLEEKHWQVAGAYGMDQETVVGQALFAKTMSLGNRRIGISTYFGHHLGRQGDVWQLDSQIGFGVTSQWESRLENVRLGTRLDYFFPESESVAYVWEPFLIFPGENTLVFSGRVGSDDPEVELAISRSINDKSRIEAGASMDLAGKPAFSWLWAIPQHGQEWRIIGRAAESGFQFALQLSI